MKKKLSAIILSGMCIGAFASTETNICIQNPSTKPFYMSVSGINNDDWNGVSRPDNNFNRIAINPGETHCEREEVERSHWAARFVFVVNATNGESKSSDMMLNPSKGWYWMSKDYSPLLANGDGHSQDGYTEGFDCPAGSGDHCRLFKISY
ncbi:MAG: hypothetical protein ACXV8O_14310 [Methylobacter sp.]